jgi:hypothetical protein
MMTTRDIIFQRGLVPTYVTGSACPGCGGRAWEVGRVSAECGACGTTLPLPIGASSGSSRVVASGGFTVRESSFGRFVTRGGRRGGRS